MKPKTDEPAPTVAVTTKVKLTIQGQTFDMSMAELDALYEVVRKALNKPEKQFVPMPVNDEARRRPINHWLTHPPLVAPAVSPFDPPYKITCGLVAETPPMKRMTGGYASTNSTL